MKTIIGRNSDENPLLVGVALLASLLLIAGVIFAIELPVAQDFPNHLARYWLIAGGAKVEPTSNMFAIDWWNASTNIGGDVLAAILVKVVPYWVAGKLLLFVSIAGPPIAAAWLNRILFGRWTWWSLSFLFLAWTMTTLLGLMNHQMSLAAALLFACLDALMRWPIFPRLIARVVFAAVALLIHPFGLVFFVLLLLALTIGPSWDGLLQRQRLATIARNAVWPIVAGLVPVAVLLAWSPSPPGEHHVFAAGYFYWLPFRPLRLLSILASAILTYRIWVDLLLFAPLLAISLYSVRIGKARTHAGMFVVALVTIVVALIMPYKVGDAQVLDRRLPLMAALMFFTSVLPEPFETRSGRRAAAAAMFAIVAARTLWVGSVWFERERDVRAIERSLSSVPAGAAVLEVESEPAAASAPVGTALSATLYWAQNTLLHVPVMAIPWRKAFVPTLFAVPGQQPVRIIPPWTELKSLSLAVPDVHLLDPGAESDIPEEMSYLRDWWTKFDYVIAIQMDREDARGPFTPPRQLSLVDDEGYARLYRVER
jgi:hypothetical protein